MRLPRNSHRRNILSVYERVDETDRVEGIAAYPRYHEMMRAIAGYYGFPLEAVVAAFCALSPNNDYMGNLRSTVTLLMAAKLGLGPADCSVSTYNSCKMRAWNFINGVDFLSVTKGPKTRAFYRNILDPSDPEPITIDGHMVGIYLGQRFRMVEVARTRFNYDQVAASFRRVAKSLGLVPNQLQAMLWFTWKRIHNVKYDPQMDVFYQGNQWKNNLNPALILPFRIGHAGNQNVSGGVPGAAGVSEYSGREGTRNGILLRHPDLFPNYCDEVPDGEGHEAGAR